MRTNPGGQIDLQHVIGRDELAAQLWEALNQQSLLMTAERRIGKTTVLKKMEANPPAGWFPVYMDLERAHTAEEFAFHVYNEVQKFLGNQKKVLNRVTKWLADNGLKMGAVVELEKRPHSWKDLLICAIEDLLTEQKPNRLVFFWDEMPYMLANIRRRSNEATAMQVLVLDVLRSLRNSHAEFRMVLTGSIGMHHILQVLRQEHPGNEPLNDLFKIEIPPLEPRYSQELARNLIQGEGISSSQFEAAVALIAERADHIPFYIHHIVRGLKFARKSADVSEIEAIVLQQLVDANDPWELEHYRSRIPDYYPGADGKWVELLLDELALATQPQSVNELHLRVKAQGSEFDDRKRLLNVLRLMDLDHYVQKTIAGQYQFRFPLIQRWWKLAQGL